MLMRCCFVNREDECGVGKVVGIGVEEVDNSAEIGHQVVTK
jgi:hypothetical protein